MHLQRSAIDASDVRRIKDRFQVLSFVAPADLTVDKLNEAVSARCCLGGV